MAERPENRDPAPTTRAPDRSAPIGIIVTIGVVALVLVALAFLFGAFDGDENAVESTDNTMLGGGITGAEAEDVIEDQQ